MIGLVSRKAENAAIAKAWYRGLTSTLGSDLLALCSHESESDGQPPGRMLVAK